MPPLRPEEQRCLAYFVEHPDSPSPAQLSSAALDNLVLRGLLDRHPVFSMPPLLREYRYRITERGRRILSKSSD